MARARLLVADDHPQTLNMLCSLLEPEFEVVGAVTNGRMLVDAAAELAPDVIATDIMMPGLDGIEATRELLRVNPDARVVFVSVDINPVLVRRGLAAGAVGYVLKDTAGDELVPAVQAALRGEQYVTRRGGDDHGI